MIPPKQLILLAICCLALTDARAEILFQVQALKVADQKAVFATVESRRVVPARARIGGVVAELTIEEGDEVKLGQRIAAVGDEKLALQLKSLDAQISGLHAQVEQTRTDLSRAEGLTASGTIPRARLDEARTAFNVADNALRARIAERSVVQQQLAEGNVLAPASGRVLRVLLTAGSVLLAGETVAQIAEAGFVLRLRVPERHARFLKAGDPIWVDGGNAEEARPLFGKVSLVYPQIEDGRVVADALVDGLGEYFVGERIGVRISTGERTALVVPKEYIATRFGVDYVKLRDDASNLDIDVPVQRGRDLPRPDLPSGIEILSGLKAGDQLVWP